MVSKDVYRGDVIQCHGFSNGEILSYKLPSGKVSHRYGKFDQIVEKNVFLIDNGNGTYIYLDDSVSHFNGNNYLVILATRPYGEGAYYIDKDSLRKYEYSAVVKPSENSEMQDSGVKLSKK